MSDTEKLLDEVKLLYVKYCETYQVWQRTREASDASKEAEAKLNEVKKVTEDFINKANKLVMEAIRGTDEYKRFTIMLGYAKNAKIEWMCQDPRKVEDCKNLMEQVVKELEPYEDDLMGIYPLLFACLKHFIIIDLTVKSYFSISKLLMFKVKLNADPKYLQVWNGIKLFDLPEHVQSKDFIDYQAEHNIFVLQKTLHEIAEQDLLKNSINETKETMLSLPKMIETASKKLRSYELMDKIEAICILKEISTISLSTFRFKQVQLALSVAMYNLVKIRRDLPMAEKSSLNELQAALCNIYTAYGIHIISGAMGKNEVPDPNPNYIEMTDLVEPGIEIYMSQFPTEYVKDPILKKKILKKASAWNQRSIELCGNNQKKMEEYTTFTDVLNISMTAVKNDIKKMQGNA